MRTYAVKDVFRTVQGEGALAGTPAIFVRFSGCNLWSGRQEDRGKGGGACSAWCDTEFVGGERLAASELVQKVLALCDQSVAAPPHPSLVVVTGGEPLLQLDTVLVHLLNAEGLAVAVETNGTRPAPENIDWITLSPKKGPVPLAVLPPVHELKIILPGADASQDWSDRELEQLASFYQPSFRFVQPQDGAPDGVERCLRFVQAHPGWRLSAQSHKQLGIP